MAAYAKCDEVFDRVMSELASFLDMVDLKTFPLSAFLTSPAITLQHSLTKFPVGFWFKLDSRPLLAKHLHDARRNCSRNSLFCGCGSRPYNRPSDSSKASGLPASKLAPARKSAQIISRQ
jgi:hypothetical protein